MITDRSISDVNSTELLRKKMQSGQSLTVAEKAIFERGTCTAEMLNRIENKQSELALILNGYSYMVNITTKQWTYADIFSNADYNRILGNLNKLRQAFYTYANTPVTPVYLYGYLEANNAEKILVDIENMISDMEGYFMQCGTFQSGEYDND